MLECLASEGNRVLREYKDLKEQGEIKDLQGTLGFQGHQEMLGSLDHRDCSDQKDLLVHQALGELKESKELLDQLEDLAQEAHLVPKGWKVLEVNQDPLGHKDRKEQKEPRENRVFLALLESLGLKVTGELMGRLEMLENLEILEKMVPQEKLEIRGQEGYLVKLGHLDPLDLLVLLEMQGQRVSQEEMGTKGRQDRLALKVFLELLDNLDLKALLAHLERKEKKAPLVPLAQLGCLVYLEQKAYLGQRGLRVHRGLRALRATKVTKDIRVYPDCLAFLVPMVLLGTRERWGLQDQLAQLAVMDLQVHLGLMVFLALQAHKALKVPVA